MARMPSVNASAAPRAAPAFLHGKSPGSTSPKGPPAQARADFGGVAPSPPAVRRLRPSRPVRTAKPLTHKALVRLWMFRWRG